MDLAAVQTLGPAILEYVAAAYPGAEDVRDRIAFYKGTFALQDALFGLENDDEAAFRAGMVEYV